jgi:ABC-type amino acid transport substrate-binding protein
MSLRNPSRRGVLSAGLVLGSLVFSHARAAPQPLRLGYWDNPPDFVAYQRAGQDGPVFAVVEHAAAAIGARVDWRRVTPGSGLEEIAAGRLDALAFVSHLTPERLKVGWGGASMGMRAREVHFALRKSDAHVIDRWSDLKGLKIGYVRSRYYMQRFHEDTSLTTVGFESETDMARAMLSGGIDTIVTNNRMRLQQQLLVVGFNEFRFAGLVVREDQDVMLLNSRASAAEPVLRRLDAEIAQMRRRGVIADIFVAYGVAPPK